MAQKKKRSNSKSGAGLIRNLPKQSRSRVMVDELKRIYPNAKTEYFENAIEVSKTCEFNDDESKTDKFGKVLAAVIIDEIIGKVGGGNEHN